VEFLEDCNHGKGEELDSCDRLTFYTYGIANQGMEYETSYSACHRRRGWPRISQHKRNELLATY
jgi:hypothetical protein